MLFFATYLLKFYTIAFVMSFHVMCIVIVDLDVYNYVAYALFHSEWKFVSTFSPDIKFDSRIYTTIR